MINSLWKTHGMVKGYGNITSSSLHSLIRESCYRESPFDWPPGNKAYVWIWKTITVKKVRRSYILLLTCWGRRWCDISAAQCSPLSVVLHHPVFEHHVRHVLRACDTFFSITLWASFSFGVNGESIRSLVRPDAGSGTCGSRLHRRNGSVSDSSTGSGSGTGTETGWIRMARARMGLLFYLYFF